MTPPVSNVDETAEVKSRRDVLQRFGRPVLVLVLIYLVASTVWTQVTADQATEDKEAVQEQAKAAVNPVDQLCAEGGLVAEELNRRGACEKAREVLESPDPTPGVAGPSRQDIAAAVADYLRDNPPAPGRPPTVGEITAAVATYLTENPPVPGRPPTPTEIATAVAGYLQENPPPSGQDGAAGPPPTSEQIAAAVNDYLQTNPPPPGPPGPAGPVCPDGYELRPVVAVTADGGTYTDAVQCVRPESFQPPDEPEPGPPLIPLPGG